MACNSWLFVVELVWQDGETPLHIAMESYNPSDKESIRLCVMLIEKNADLSIRNKVMIYTLNRVQKSSPSEKARW